jgi:hypothetical protein
MIDVLAKAIVLCNRLDQLLPPGTSDVSWSAINTTLAQLSVEGWTNGTGIKKP